MSKQPNKEELAGMTIDDVMGETFQTYLTEEDARLIRDTFKGNSRLLRVLQKVFIPTIQDPEMPPEQMAEDFWMSGIDWEMMSAEEVKAIAAGRSKALKTILGGIIRIKVLANAKEEDLQANFRRKQQDSNK